MMMSGRIEGGPVHRILVNLALLVVVVFLPACSKNKAILDLGPSEWEIVPLPIPSGYANVTVKVIRGLSHDDVWVLASAGRTDDPGAPYGLSFHFDGSSWVAAEVPARATMSLYPVSPTEVWAVGAYGTVARWDGKRWSASKIERVDYDLLDVVAWHDDVWVATAGPNVLHFDGQRWSSVAPPELAGIETHEIFGTRDGEVMVPCNPAGRVPSIARYAKGTWTVERVGPGGVVHIAGSGPRDLWAVGATNHSYHFDGSAWTRFATASKRILGAYATSPTEAYLVGTSGSILVWDGAAWTPSSSGTSGDLWTVFAPPGGKPLAGGAPGLLRHR